MKTEIQKNNSPTTRKFVPAESILKFIIGGDEKLDTMIVCKTTNVALYTTDFALHEAFGSLKDYDEISAAKIRKLAKFFENVAVHSFEFMEKKPKPVLTHERVEELRLLALRFDSNKS
ncbi:hypothetical protein FJZ26_06320 [Candidatus Parvarchaeota archaeon]|nr:hypothetical protein [Candidatus Parvarchaeota archaeon]